MAEVYDAVIYPRGWTPEGKVSSMESRLEALRVLLDSKGRLIHFRDQGNSFFVTLDLYDTELYPIGHPREKQPRYDWIEKGGCRLGKLKVEPK